MVWNYNDIFAFHIRKERVHYYCSKKEHIIYLFTISKVLKNPISQLEQNKRILRKIAKQNKKKQKLGEISSQFITSRTSNRWKKREENDTNKMFWMIPCIRWDNQVKWHFINGECQANFSGDILQLFWWYILNSLCLHIYFNIESWADELFKKHNTMKIEYYTFLILWITSPQTHLELITQTNDRKYRQGLTSTFLPQT